LIAAAPAHLRQLTFGCLLRSTAHAMTSESKSSTPASVSADEINKMIDAAFKVRM
jgi:hypothetical protein